MQPPKYSERIVRFVLFSRILCTFLYKEWFRKEQIVVFEKLRSQYTRARSEQSSS